MNETHFCSVQHSSFKFFLFFNEELNENKDVFNMSCVPQLADPNPTLTKSYHTPLQISPNSEAAY